MKRQGSTTFIHSHTENKENGIKTDFSSTDPTTLGEVVDSTEHAIIKEIVDCIEQHPDGLTVYSIAKITGKDRDTTGRIVFKLLNGVISYPRKIVKFPTSEKQDKYFTLRNFISFLLDKTNPTPYLQSNPMLKEFLDKFLKRYKNDDDLVKALEKAGVLDLANIDLKKELISTSKRKAVESGRKLKII